MAMFPWRWECAACSQPGRRGYDRQPQTRPIPLGKPDRLQACLQARLSFASKIQSECMSPRGSRVLAAARRCRCRAGVADPPAC
eukprot:4910647-Prymnesium_polylepis.1